MRHLMFQVKINSSCPYARHEGMSASADRTPFILNFGPRLSKWSHVHRFTSEEIVSYVH
jgi:hypothetical protein